MSVMPLKNYHKMSSYGNKIKKKLITQRKNNLFLKVVPYIFQILRGFGREAC